MVINLTEYREVDLMRYEPKVGDVIYHPKTKKIELIISKITNNIELKGRIILRKINEI